MRIMNLAVVLGVMGLCATLCVTQAFAQESLYGQSKVKHYANSLAPYVVSPQEIVDRMLELADLRPGEKLYDLVPSPNGRIHRLGLDNDARVIPGNFLDTDLSPADVVTLYLATDANELLRPNLERYLRRGARVVSHEYAVPGWKPKLVDKDPERHGHTIFLYDMPPKKK